MKIINYLIVTLFIISGAHAMEQEEQFFMQEESLLAPEDAQRIKDQVRILDNEARQLIGTLQNLPVDQAFKSTLQQNRDQLIDLEKRINIILDEPLSQDERESLSQLQEALHEYLRILRAGVSKVRRPIIIPPRVYE